MRKGYPIAHSISWNASRIGMLYLCTLDKRHLFTCMYVFMHAEFFLKDALDFWEVLTPQFSRPFNILGRFCK